MPIDPYTGVVTSNGTEDEIRAALNSRENARAAAEAASAPNAHFSPSIGGTPSGDTIRGKVWTLLAHAVFLGILFSALRGFAQEAAQGLLSRVEVLICLGVLLLTIVATIGFVRTLWTFIRTHPIAAIVLVFGGIWLCRHLPSLPHLTTSQPHTAPTIERIAPRRGH